MFKSFSNNKTLSLLAILTIVSTNISKAQQNTGTTVAENNNLFALKLLEKLSSESEKNVFVSPFSISTALAMAYVAADGETASEMAKVLHFENDKNLFEKKYGEYIQELNTNAFEKVTLETANCIWTDLKVRLLPSYSKVTKEVFNAPQQQLNFKTDPENSRNIINKWVEDKTNKHIKDLLPSGLIKSDTRIVLTNAIYFKGDWLHTFNKNATIDNDFYPKNGTKIQVPFMQQRNHFAYYQNQNLQALELPYKGNNHSMVVVLPAKNQSTTTVQKEINSAFFRQLNNQKRTLVMLKLPKFKATLPLTLKEPLQQLGLNLAFGDGADFSKMAIGESLKISEIIHKAFIDVDEQGTEAAAATAILMQTTSSAMHQPEMPIPFFVERPFLIYIIDKKTNNILFMGNIQNPK